jgi:nucleoside-diphosphate-sugar epimerase
MKSAGVNELPDRIETEAQLDDFLCRPSADLVEAIRNFSSPLLILGAGGKMGPTLAVLAKRAAAAASHPLEVIAVSRFGNLPTRKWLEENHVKVEACDLLERDGLARLPESQNIIYLVGLKFGTAQNPSATWVVNTIVPARVAERFPHAAIVALSTGNVYSMSEFQRGGAVETDALTPRGEYANAAVARERIFEFYSDRQRTRMTLLRLFYAVELRYGVLVDIGRKVFAGEAIDLATGYFNCIWQGDANDMVLRSLALASSPPSVWNLCQPQIFYVREVAMEFGKVLNRAPRLAGSEASTALLGNSMKLCARLGAPQISVSMMVRWIAHWLEQGGRDLNRPTHFEVRDGNY